MENRNNNSSVTQCENDVQGYKIPSNTKLNNMCTWNMSGLAKWKMYHKDVISVLETNETN